MASSDEEDEIARQIKDIEGTGPRRKPQPNYTAELVAGCAQIVEAGARLLQCESLTDLDQTDQSRLAGLWETLHDGRKLLRNEISRRKRNQAEYGDK